MLQVIVAVQVAYLARRPRARVGRRVPSDRPDRRRRHQLGQATAEYALVLLGVAAVALLLAAWATKSGKIGELFDAVIGELISRAK